MWYTKFRAVFSGQLRRQAKHHRLAYAKPAAWPREKDGEWGQRRETMGLRPSRTKTRQNESPAERNPDRTKSHQNDNPREKDGEWGQRRETRGLRPSRTKTRQNESPAERNAIRTTTRQKESPTERKAQFEPVYNKLCVGTVFAASGNVTIDT